MKFVYLQHSGLRKQTSHSEKTVKVNGLLFLEPSLWPLL